MVHTTIVCSYARPSRGCRSVRPARFALAVWVLAACGNRQDRLPAHDTVGVAGGENRDETRGDIRGELPDGRPRAWRVSTVGLGPLRFGQPLVEASAALAATHGGALRMVGAAGACGYAAWRGGPPGVRLLVEGGRLMRVDVDRPSTVSTVDGVGVGDSAAQVQRVYGGRARVTPAKYTAGQVLTVTPEPPADSAFRLVFEVDSGRVVRYRAGLRPAVEYVEGCG